MNVDGIGAGGFAVLGSIVGFIVGIFTSSVIFCCYIKWRHHSDRSNYSASDDV